MADIINTRLVKAAISGDFTNIHSPKEDYQV